MRYALEELPQFICNNSHVDGNCWIWSRGYFSNGYGRLQAIGETRVHRISFIIFNGPIPKGTTVQHSCNNPACVNPKHLEAKSPKKNSEYMVQCGRAAKGERHGQHIHPERTARGEKIGNAKLTKIKVREIRRLHSTRKWTIAALAREFEMGETAVRDVVKNRTWIGI